MKGIDIIRESDNGGEIIGFRISAKHGGFGFDVPLVDLVNAEVFTEEKREALLKRYQAYLADIVKTWEQPGTANRWDV